MNEEKLKEILYINCETEEGKEKLKKYLVKLKPLKKYENTKENTIPIEVLEVGVNKIIGKYMIGIQNINLTIVNKDNVSYYSASLINRFDYTWCGTVHAKTLNELMAKSLLAMYFRVKLDNIPVRI